VCTSLAASGATTKRKNWFLSRTGRPSEQEKPKAEKDKTEEEKGIETKTRTEDRKNKHLLIENKASNVRDQIQGWVQGQALIFHQTQEKDFGSDKNKETRDRGTWELGTW
jgi:CRISPR/Cas system-associated exonuclease Cas4 (RecB family)